MAEAPASMKQTIITIGIAAIKIVETDVACSIDDDLGPTEAQGSSHVRLRLNPIIQGVSLDPSALLVQSVCAASNFLFDFA